MKTPSNTREHSNFDCGKYQQRPLHHHLSPHTYRPPGQCRLVPSTESSLLAGTMTCRRTGYPTRDDPLPTSSIRARPNTDRALSSAFSTLAPGPTSPTAPPCPPVATERLIITSRKFYGPCAADRSRIDAPPYPREATGIRITTRPTVTLFMQPSTLDSCNANRGQATKTPGIPMESRGLCAETAGFEPARGYAPLPP